VINLQPITWENYDEIIHNLSTSQEQEEFCTTNVDALAKAYMAYTVSGLQPHVFGMYYGDAPIGFVKLFYDNRGKVVYKSCEGQAYYEIWHFMIDKKYQGKGYGRKGMEAVLKLLHTKPYGEAEFLYLTYETGNFGAGKFYAALGFTETGDTTEDEVTVRLKI